MKRQAEARSTIEKNMLKKWSGTLPLGQEDYRLTHIFLCFPGNLAIVTSSTVNIQGEFQHSAEDLLLKVINHLIHLMRVPLDLIRHVHNLLGLNLEAILVYLS